MTIKNGKLYKTGKGYYTYDVEYAEAHHIFPVMTAIEKQFNFSPGRLPGLGLDTAIGELVRDNIRILVGWDIWSGVYVMALDVEGNEVIQEIAEYLDPILDEIIKDEEDSKDDSQD